MPAKSEKQRKFFGAVMGAKKGKQGSSGKAKEVSKEMPEKEVKKFLKTAEEDEQSITKSMKKNNGSVKFKGPSVKQRKPFPPPVKEHAPKKGKGSYSRRGLTESQDIVKFIDHIISSDYATASKYLNRVVEQKMAKMIQQELNTPLFTK